MADALLDLTADMVIATLDMTVGHDQDVKTIRVLSTIARSSQTHRGCTAARVWREEGGAGALHYEEVWTETAELEAHIRSPDYVPLLAVMEASSTPPVLRFHFVAETRTLAWVEALRLRTRGSHLEQSSQDAPQRK